MAVIRANVDALLYEGLKKVLFDVYKEAKPIWRDIFSVDNSKKAAEKGVGFSGFSLLSEKAERASMAEDDPMLGYQTSFTHKSFALKTGISEEATDDELYGVLKKMPQALSKTAIRTEETYAAKIFNAGFTAAGDFLTGGDGKYLFATDHPLKGGGAQSNKLSTAAALTVTSFEEMVTLMRKTVGDRGEMLSLTPANLLFPPELSREAKELLASELKPNTADNAINWARDQGVKAVSPSGWAYLTSPTAWYLLTDKTEHNLTFLMRTALKTDSWRDHNTKDFLFSVIERFSIGFWDFRGVCGTEGA